ncbi:J domain-containing protein [Synechococcus sp. W2B2]|uniref:J domain-containing protein n=1 Tax=unclassified Synechococcus TaxID=2626047 RepID=UPI00006BB288|nr:J domain-containing protein [Synechococcus sp. WH 7805]EAR19608.1 Heat shock protein DnaJ-like [Synechococcus sp. WH 7805]
MATRKTKLTLPEVQQLIQDLLDYSNSPSVDDLLVFAETINLGPFKTPKQAKPKGLTATVMRKAVLNKFECKTVADLRKHKTFAMAFTGDKVGLKTTEDWRKQYRKWIAVPEDERYQKGPTCINGIDVLENFRPWHVFGLNSSTASTDDIKESYRQLVKTHHPDMGGDARVFERLQKMRDSLIALMN